MATKKVVDFAITERARRKLAKVGRIKSRKKEKKSLETAQYEQETRGVVCLSRIPHGFYENEMRKYFSQFGTVTRLKLFRSRKTGRSRGFAFIEFQFSEVAAIAAEAMNNYLMFNKLLKC